MTNLKSEQGFTLVNQGILLIEYLIMKPILTDGLLRDGHHHFEQLIISSSRQKV